MKLGVALVVVLFLTLLFASFCQAQSFSPLYPKLRGQAEEFVAAKADFLKQNASHSKLRNPTEAQNAQLFNASKKYLLTALDCMQAYLEIAGEKGSANAAYYQERLGQLGAEINASSKESELSAISSDLENDWEHSRASAREALVSAGVSGLRSGLAEAEGLEGHYQTVLARYRQAGISNAQLESAFSNYQRALSQAQETVARAERTQELSDLKVANQDLHEVKNRAGKFVQLLAAQEGLEVSP